MSDKRIYLDDNASAPLRVSAREAAVAALGIGNPSSVHDEGRSARRIVNDAREAVAALAGVSASDVIFTSGATEANAMALDPALKVNGRTVTHLLVSAIEHPSVLCGGRFPADRLIVMDVGPDGLISPQTVEAAIADLPEGAVPLVSVMAANNETGVVQPVVEIGVIVREAGGAFHCDAVQAAGRLDLATLTADADMVSLSGHKMGAPTGVGALILRGDRVSFGRPLIGGGGQERNKRAGTENVIGIAGFGAAAEAAARDVAMGRWQEVAQFRDILESSIAAAANETIFVGKSAPRLPNTACFATPGWKGETQVMQMDLAGFAISAGSACSSGKVRASGVLTAMGYDEATAQGAIRVSLGPETTKEEVLRFSQAWLKAHGKFRARAA